MVIQGCNITGVLKGAAPVPGLSERDSSPVQGDEVISGSRGDGEEPLKPKAQWLFLNYIAADCNLVKHQVLNIDTMEKVGSDADSHIVAYIDVGPKPEPLSGEWSGARSFYVTRDDTPGKIASQVVGEYGDHVDMSSPDTLKKFVVEAIKKFPATHVALILNDHGGGFSGAMADDSDGSFMSVPQIRVALQEAEKETGKKIDIIGFDACLMAEAEVAYELRDCADIMLASEENEGGPGWSYDSILGGHVLGEAVKRISESSRRGLKVTPEECAKIVVEVNRENNLMIPTFSAIDLRKMNDLKDAVNVLSNAILATEDTTSVQLGLARAENYGDNWLPYRDIHDLHDACSKIAEITSDPALKNAAEYLRNKITNEYVIANEVYEEEHPNSKGISIYFPRLIPGEIEYGYPEMQFAHDTQWDEVVRSLATNTEGSPRKAPYVWADRAHTPVSAGEKREDS